MRYALILHHLEATPEEVGEEQWNEAQTAFAAYLGTLDDAGVLVSADILEPGATATTLSATAGKLTVHDGPFTETKEQLGGVFIIDVSGVDAASAWAEKCPAAQWGAIEIRPVAVYSDDGRWVAST